MENDTCQMVPLGVQSPEGVIEGMGQPSKGVPITCVKIEKGPLEESGIN
jgi:hypothetical protein